MANGSKFTQIDSTIVVVPNSATDVTTKTTWLWSLIVANVTGTAATLLVKDKQSTARTLYTGSIAANSTLVLTFPSPVKLSGGMTWTAGTASALHASVSGYRLP